ncbi:hypothetical protein [Psychroflexus salis]|uniref:TonB-dependent receptor n=1 Tax=Psychroflexus salis TaxID=1526574 RepID=A0A917A0U2_9FLAO|nr:hypothetical protein [Psychroflexus salis]GGE19464.1 hypothetical protein GCM10010831_20720 [Psychroflexus salis]
MQAVEVLKVSSQVQYGPFTTGSAINFVSSEIPTEFNAELRANYGSYGTSNSMVRFGETMHNFGYMLEYLKNTSNGFKNLDGPGGTGLDRDDIVTKFIYTTDNDAKFKQYIELKLQYAEEDRFQWVDGCRILDGVMGLTSSGVPGTDSN